ncbi:iron-sulfur cluster biosynthesis family protein [Peribacillus alkalitolerans]|uniref:iron-sulfur cluster biosynthesis family protein n=1 Tax=Peribacillus alkalitolerans TaxID=1550385 RepID=UPI0013D56139|nr:iron-sulfur cluster biosynthesis family protein [Peribacillus alkalitolerans]
MIITWTDTAKAKLIEKTQEQDGYLKLKYDTEGCGCVVNGVPTLWFVSELDDDDQKVETNAGDIYVEKSKQIFMDDIMKIDFVKDANCFQLKSPGGMLNPRMGFVKKVH